MQIRANGSLRKKDTWKWGGASTLNPRRPLSILTDGPQVPSGIFCIPLIYPHIHSTSFNFSIITLLHALLLLFVLLFEYHQILVSIAGCEASSYKLIVPISAFPATPYLISACLFLTPLWLSRGSLSTQIALLLHWSINHFSFFFTNFSPKLSIIPALDWSFHPPFSIPCTLFPSVPFSGCYFNPLMCHFIFQIYLSQSSTFFSPFQHSTSQSIISFSRIIWYSSQLAFSIELFDLYP